MFKPLLNTRLPGKFMIYAFVWSKMKTMPPLSCQHSMSSERGHKQTHQDFCRATVKQQHLNILNVESGVITPENGVPPCMLVLDSSKLKTFDFDSSRPLFFLHPVWAHPGRSNVWMDGSMDDGMTVFNSYIQSTSVKGCVSMRPKNPSFHSTNQIHHLH